MRLTWRVFENLAIVSVGGCLYVEGTEEEETDLWDSQFRELMLFPKIIDHFEEFREFRTALHVLRELPNRHLHISRSKAAYEFY